MQQAAAIGIALTAAAGTIRIEHQRAGGGGIFEESVGCQLSGKAIAARVFLSKPTMIVLHVVAHSPLA